MDQRLELLRSLLPLAIITSRLYDAANIIAPQAKEEAKLAVVLDYIDRLGFIEAGIARKEEILETLNTVINIMNTPYLGYSVKVEKFHELTSKLFKNEPTGNGL